MCFFSARLDSIEDVQFSSDQGLGSVLLQVSDVICQPPGQSNKGRCLTHLNAAVRAISQVIILPLYLEIQFNISLYLI